ncbi:hypothetical protein G6F54_014534 [Rhizopus delemar]|nr:hypothetical protein G6F54_014534 [Rhizopus delemar]
MVSRLLGQLVDMRQRTAGADCAMAGMPTVARPAPAAPAACARKRRRCMYCSRSIRLSPLGPASTHANAASVHPKKR